MLTREEALACYEVLEQVVTLLQRRGRILVSHPHPAVSA